MPEIRFNLMIITDGADGKLHAVSQEAKEVKQEIEKPAEVKISAEKALATVRDVKIAFDGVTQVLSGLVNQINGYLDASLAQRQAVTLSKLAFGEAADEMGRFASSMQQVTNFEDDQLLALMSKLAQTFKLNKDEIQELTPMLLDFTEANKATGMTVESAFDLMGRALNGHTEMLGRYGIELDSTRLKTEGVAYLVQKLGEDYGGTAIALADLRLQNANAWGDIKETIGDMLTVVITPLLQGLNYLMQAYQSLNPVVKGLVTGIGLAVPIFVSLALAVTASTAAITALKTAINPVVGIIGLVVSVLSGVGFAFAAASMSSKDLSQEQETLAEKLKTVQTEVDVEAEKFNQLGVRLLALRGQASLTAQDKTELAGIIKTLNSNYSEYLGNINLETAGYDALTAALNRASNALVSQQIAKLYGQQYSAQIDQIAKLTVKLDDLRPRYQQLKKDQESMAATFPQGAMSDQNPMGFNPDAWTGGKWGAIEKELKQYSNTAAQLYRAKSDLEKVAAAYSQALADIPAMVFSGGEGGSSSASASITKAKSEIENLIDELSDYVKTDSQKLSEEYRRRRELILENTTKDSSEQQIALINLGLWKLDQDKKITDAQIAEEQKRFTSQIDYYSNLESLGVASYDALKKTMQDYYDWAKINLPKEEAALILAQMQEADLKWAQHQADKANQEITKFREMAQIRDDFRKKDLELDGRDYQLRLLQIEEYYSQHEAKMREAGITEIQIEEQKNKAILGLQLTYATQIMGGTTRVLGTLAGAMNKESEKGFNAWRALAMAQATVDMIASANASYKSMAGIPVVGPGLAIAAAAAAVAAGLINIRKIEQTKFEKKAATGMYVDGPSHSQGGVPIEVEGGEFITRKERVSALGKRFYEFLNFAPISAVRSMLGGLSMPGLAVPMPDYAFATGGYVGQGGTMGALMSAIEALTAKIEAMSRPVVQISVDPLSNDPVRISEIAEMGRMIRSEV